ncbi:hypothetical protein CYLTODRAFT_315771, partial [Cylindrobasidium torrendii FP15055 ss-10]
PQCEWSKDEESLLLDGVCNELSRAGDGANLKKSFWTSLATGIPAENGAPKSAAACKTKYTRVRGTWKIVAGIIRNSGWSWDSTYGANITPELSTMWEEYVNANPKAAPYRNEGWIHEEIFRQIQP